MTVSPPRLFPHHALQADGLLLATPTGSTAYSLAANGSMVHPSVPAILFTPICPHSLASRPVILPDSACLELRVPQSARSSVWVSFDGKERQELQKGDRVVVRMSDYPMPTVNRTDHSHDWFESLSRCLSWNERIEQRPLSAPPYPARGAFMPAAAAPPPAAQPAAAADKGVQGGQNGGRAASANVSA